MAAMERLMDGESWMPVAEEVRSYPAMKVQRVEKPWGFELLLARTEQYAGKILCIRGGHRLSLQHHARKDETLFLLQGEMVLEWEAEPFEPHRHRMLADEAYRVRAGQRHRLVALSDARVLEISTPELDDVVRWEDDYGRCVVPAGCVRGEAQR
jgi:mannose-6-phosphate isomerase-like protein (cupin superfamily)